MAYTSAQIVALACQIAKVPGYTSMAGQFLNTILEELWQVYDFAFSRQKTYINLTQTQVVLEGEEKIHQPPPPVVTK